MSEAQQVAQPEMEEGGYFEQIGCPECGGEMRPDGGCKVCMVCGYSPCS